MKQMLCLYKPVGVTPLQLIHTFKELNFEYQNVKLSYAGRLDPMADGLLLVLAGEENTKRKEYESLPKEYECSVLFGIETDTYDILGKVTHTGIVKDNQYIVEKVKNLLPGIIGKQKQPYPPYSSRPVNGKPLYYWARQNKISELTIPTKDIEIYEITCLSQTEITKIQLKNLISERLEKVIGDFRQNEIKEMWKVFFENNRLTIFPVMQLRVSCSSGTYIRSLAHKLGKEVGGGAIAMEITRTKIGEYTLNHALYLEYNNLDAKR